MSIALKVLYTSSYSPKCSDFDGRLFINVYAVLIVPADPESIFSTQKAIQIVILTILLRLFAEIVMVFYCGK